MCIPVALYPLGTTGLGPEEYEVEGSIEGCVERWWSAWLWMCRCGCSTDWSNSSRGLLIIFQSMRLGGLVWHLGVSLSCQDKIRRTRKGASYLLPFLCSHIQRYWIVSMGFWCFFAMWCCFSTDSSLCTVTPLDFSITSRCKVEAGFALPNASLSCWQVVRLVDPAFGMT